MLWSCPHPALVDLFGVYHHVWCPYVADGDDYDNHVHLEPNESREHQYAPQRCKRCYPDLRLVGR